ncbi:MAG TPA: Xaa-Pro peptidase family protein [Candidatus Saccharimonadales bacterium]|nr:Xaa-Pro peptidase family protein [Candidatus Saccharimonadales bacterium]
MNENTTASPGPAPLLFYGDSYRFPDIYHATRFLAPDAFIAYEEGEELVILTNSLEQGRAEKQSRATSIQNVDAFGMQELVSGGLSRADAEVEVIGRFLAQRGVRRIRVAPYFPLGTADRLRAAGLELVVATDLEARRRTKRPDEIAALEAIQGATEAAWLEGVDAIVRATEGRDGVLMLDGEVFTAERLRAIVEGALLTRGAVAESTICAPGRQAADPHLIGSGPLHAREAIVMDIYPQDKATRYYADMTRTVSKGDPPDAILRMYEVVERAQDAGIAALRPGITGRAVHELVEDLIFEAGYDTLRAGQKHDPADPVTRGFIHGTGHGVGLEIHEAPSIGRAGSDPLAIGDVVTVEPGVDDPAVGGVRLEDMLLVTADGSRNFTRAPRRLVI